MSLVFEGVPWPENRHEILLRACTNYLSITDVRILSMFFTRNGPSFFDALFIFETKLWMIDYAASYWLYHLESAELATG